MTMRRLKTRIVVPLLSAALCFGIAGYSPAVSETISPEMVATGLSQSGGLGKQVSSRNNPGKQQSPKSPNNQAVPSVAADEGFRRLALDDSFDSTKTIDTELTGDSGFLWYPAGIDAWSKKDTTKDEYSVSNSVLRIDPKHRTFNYNFATRDPNTGEGQSFGQGYFEARMRWEARTDVPKVTEGTDDNGYSWPAFWSFSHKRISENKIPYCELDFAESQRPNEVLSTIWAWHGKENPDKIRNRKNTHTAEGLDLSEWHTYGTLWAPGKVQWYLDGELIAEQHWTGEKAKENMQQPIDADGNDTSRGNPFSMFDQENEMNVILGTGTGRPFEVDWVRVWQR
ncbi:hypothetical protein GCM10025785_07770 [Corynebacterium canis]